MCREVIYFCAELLNYWSMTFFGLKLFAKVYDIHMNENKVVENMLFIFICLPISWNAAGNHMYSPYSTFLTYIMIIYMYIVICFLNNRRKEISLSLIAFYIFGIRLVDLWIVSIITEISKISRAVEIDLIHTGLDRIIFILILSVGYYMLHHFLIENNIIYYLVENKNYRRIICFYSFVGIACFSTIYRFDYKEKIINYWIIYLICAFLLLGTFIMYVIRNKGKEREKILNMRNDIMEMNYITLQKVYEMNKTLQHDYKNHLLAINELIKENKNEEAAEYIYTYIKYSESSLVDIKSGNDIVDIIVNSKMSEAKDKNLKFIYEVDYLGNLIIEDIDMCSLLANLLDNAIEACSKVNNKEKYIDLKIYIKNSMLIIILINSVNEDITKKKYFFKSEKKNLQLHGWGMKSIEYVVKKYGGIKEYYLENKTIEFVITIPV